MANKRKTVKAKAVPSVKRAEYHVKVARNVIETFTVFATSAEEANELVRCGEGNVYETHEDYTEILEDQTLQFFEGE